VTAKQPAAHAGGRPRDPQSGTAFIDAVLSLVGEGATLSGLSLVTIADRAGISRNSLYRRWKTKEALYLDVLASINRPLPELAGRSARQDVIELIAVLVERTLDRRASQMLRALNAEAEAFPDLHRRYFRDIVAPRRRAMNDALCRGVASGEIRSDVDVDLISEVLVSPILARLARGETDGLDPRETSERITSLVFAGATPRD
jgi:AcrR family transcriptional regulator